MASGSFGVSTSNGYISAWVEWTSSDDVIENNRSWVTATLRASRTNSYTTSGSGSFTVNINGDAHTNSQSFSVSYNSNTVLCTHACWVGHEADGSKSITISVSGGMPSTTFSSCSGSGTATLDVIPRASQPSLSYTSYDMGYTNGLTINMNRASTSFTHTVSYAFGNASGTISTGVGDNVAWTMPLDLASQIPNSTSGYGTITVDTYSGGTYIGTKTVGFTANVPSSVVPSFTSITASELNSSISSIVGKYVQRLSNIRFTINGASGSYGSSISAYTINYLGTNYGGSSIDTGAISWNGTQRVTATITDSRGRTASRYIDVTVIAYNYPAITGLTLTRCSDSAGNTPSSMGTYVKVNCVGSVSSLVNGTEKNTMSYTIYYKARNTSTWSTGQGTTSIAGLTMNVSPVLTPTFSATSSFDFRLDVTDKFNTTMSLTVLPTGQVCMSWSPTGIGVGKVWESGVLDVGGDANVDRLIVRKNADKMSEILFPAQTNDAGFIKHFENNNQSTMYFSVSDDADTNDYFAFGATPSNTWREGARIYANGQANFGVTTMDGVQISSVARDISGTDLNTYKTTGFARGYNLSNSPAWNTWFYVMTIKHDDSYVLQQVWDYWGNTFFRRLQGGTWTSWNRLQLDSNFNGSLGNNGYKWADGLMFSWGFYGGLWLAANWNTFNFHNAFPNSCFQVNATCNYSGSGAYMTTLRPVSNSQFEIYQPSECPIGGTITEIYYFAIGY